MTDSLKIKTYRKWLNEKDEGATGTVQVTGELYKDGHSDHLYLYLDIRDCSNAVSLDFSAYTEKKAKKRLKKIQKIQKALSYIEVELNKFIS